MIQYFKSFFLSLMFFLLVPTVVLSGIAIKIPEGMEKPPAMVAVSPARLELKIGKKPANSSLKLFNLADEPVTIVATVHNWDLDDNNRVRIVEPTPQSLDQWMIINPVKFTIPPHSFQTIRLSIRPNVEPIDGEHRGLIYFTQLLPEPDKVKGGIHAQFRIGVIVYGLAGNIVRSGKLGSITFQKERDKGKIMVEVTSTGNAGIRVKGEYSIWKRASFTGIKKVSKSLFRNHHKPHEPIEAGNLTILPVLPGTHRTLVTTFKLPQEPGDYVLLVKGSLGKKDFTRQFFFTITSQ